ncbi:MAG: hypothetical protein FAF04_08550 [Epsilonproteobacteria bacterium]|nr:hypothetical protein [Campylobacterota bacterium]
MHKSLLFTTVLLVLTSALSAGEKYSVRGVYGWATSKDLGDIVLSGKLSPDFKEYKVYSVDGGYLLWENINEWPLDIYAKGGLFIRKITLAIHTEEISISKPFGILISGKIVFVWGLEKESLIRQSCLKLKNLML